MRLFNNGVSEKHDCFKILVFYTIISLVIYKSIHKIDFLHIEI